LNYISFLAGRVCLQGKYVTQKMDFFVYMPTVSPGGLEYTTINGLKVRGDFSMGLGSNSVGN